MKNYDWAGCKVEVDEIATREWYAQAEEWNCECGHCRNFMAFTDRLPEELLTLLYQLEIPAKKAVDVCNLTSRKGDLLLYEIRYRLAGRILKRNEDQHEEKGLLQKIYSFFRVQWPKKRESEYPDPWELIRCLDEPGMLCSLYPDAFPQPCFELCIQLWLPWVLDEPIDG